MENDPENVPIHSRELASVPALENLQKTYQNTLEFHPGQSVHIYVGGTKYSFQNVSSFAVDIVHSHITILTPKGRALFRNWDGIEVGQGQSTNLVVSSES